MRLTNVIIIALAVLLPGSAISQDGRIDRVVAGLLEEPLYSGISEVTPEIRDEVIRHIRGSVSDVAFAQTEGKARARYLLLVRLGDVDATKQVLDAMRTSLSKPERGWPLNGFLVNNAQPVVIPLIAKDFLRNDGDTVEYVDGSDNPYYIGSPSVEMCRLALKVIFCQDVFSPEATAWAKANLQRVDSARPQHTREMMQKWWRDNEQHFLTHNYQAVQPGEVLRDASVSESIDGGGVPSSGAPKMSPQLVPQGGGKGLASSSTRSGTGQGELFAPPKHKVWFWAAIFVAAVCGWWFFVRKVPK